MRSLQESMLLFFNAIRCLPHLIIYLLHPNRSLIKKDIIKGIVHMEQQYKFYYGFLYLLSFCKEFRNVFYYRTRPFSFFLDYICRSHSTTFLQCPDIGEGFTLVHGFSCAIGPAKIGKNCTIFQQVTIGGTDQGAPVLGDNITVFAGAVIIGRVRIGNNVTIGANATVYTNVPDNSTVLPGSSKVFRWKK